MKYTTNRRINVRTVRRLTSGQGFILRNGKIVKYKGGWQVATDYGVKVYNPEDAMKWTRILTQIIAGSSMARNVSVWYKDGAYYVSCGKRIPTKKEAIAQGQKANQTSIYSWSRKKESLQYL